MDFPQADVYLRLITVEDAAFLRELMNTQKWLTYIGDRKVRTLADAEAYIQQKMHPDIQRKGFVNHLIIKRSTHEPIGTCSLHDREGVEGMDIGYALLPEYEGNGYATFGACSMVDLAIHEYNQQRISAITTEQNTGSCRLLEKIGFQFQRYFKFPGSKEKIKLYVLKTNGWKGCYQ
ncbi:MAG: GNAT family N-acetyltransferase [Bacteroidota bacterium]